MSDLVYVAVGPRREGMWKQPPIVGTSSKEVAQRAAKEFELPAPALDISNWTDKSRAFQRSVWYYKSLDVRYSDSHDGKHYIYERELD